MAEQNFSCPQCGSDNIQRFSVAFRGGASTIDTKTSTTGIGIGRGGLGVGTAGSHTTGVQMTQLAKEVAPPAKKKYMFPIIISLIIWIVVDRSFLSVMGTTAAGIPGYISLAAALWYFVYQKVYVWNKNVWPGLYEKWEKSWVCLKCGHKFIM